MKALVTGARGQLGYDIVAELNRRGLTAVGTDKEETDITDSLSVESIMLKERPDVVFHCAAWTAVDAAEEEENKEKVFLVNEVGTKNIARQCRAVGSKMVYISTDYVFDGTGTQPWKADCREFKPLNVYGESKLAGEKAVLEILDEYFIVRIAWVFGVHGGNFVKTMLKIGNERETVRVVNDQIGTPTYTADLARLLVDMALTEKYGCYHATNEGGFISWADFAAAIFEQAKYKTQVVSVSTSEYGLSKAARPFNSRLDKSKLTENGFTPLPDWRDALERYLKEIDFRWVR
ncbi:MAG: dTDP-4-dehydrorhamnose reductase [Clostridia bacterium]|nr:dTDP-4-dehydrorhamnose reductase [Clostridia bacterium]